MAFDINTYVGPQQKAQGSAGQVRSDRQGALATTDAHGRYMEAVINGRVFSAATATGGVSIASLTLTTTGPFALYNPIGSGVNIALWRLSMGYLSGTLGAGLLFLAGNTSTSAAAFSGTAIAATPNFLGNPVAVGAQGKALTTATVPAGAVILRPLWNLGAALASTALGASVCDPVEFGGDFVIAPGCGISVQGVTLAGSSPLVHFGATWEEIPV